MLRCGSCSQYEQQCKCERLCLLCQSDYEIRLCEDGYYYCKDCREACDYRAES
jgi:hypothetical protein